MKVINMYLFVVLFLFSLNSNSFSGILTHPPDTNMETSGWWASSFNDFHPSAIVYCGAARYFNIKAEYGYIAEKNVNNQWSQVEDVVLNTNTTPETVGVWQLVDGLFYTALHIAQHGNGQYRVKCFVKAYSVGWPTSVDETGWTYCTITDIIAPSTPSSFSGTWNSGIPYISWSSVIQDDLEEYVIYKKVNNGNWGEYATTVNTNYSDGYETQYIAGSGEKRFVYYKVTARDFTNNESTATTQQSFICQPWLNKTNIDECTETVSIDKYMLKSNYPNPFNPSTNIIYHLKENGFVSLIIYNSTGQEVVVLENQQREKGIYNVDFNASNLPSGIYIYRLQVHTADGKGDFVDAKKMLFLK